MKRSVFKDSCKKIDNRTAKIAVLGLAYKRDIADTRESPAKKIIEEIVKESGNVKVYDPYAKSIRIKNTRLISQKNITDTVKEADCAIFIVDHSSFREIDLEGLSKAMRNPIIMDCKNVFKKPDSDHIIYYGIGKPLR